MADQDPIDEFIALPRTQQLATLQKLSPDKQDTLLAKTKERRSSPKPADDDFPIAPNGPEDRTVGNYVSEGVSGIGRGLKNDVLGMYQSAIHPIDTAEGVMKQANESGEAAGKEFRDLKGVPLGQRLGATALAGLEKAPLIGGMVQHAEEGGEQMGSPESVGAAAEAITTFGAPELAGKGVKTVGDLRSTLRAKYGPKAVDIAGEKVPVLAGEAAPDSPAGRLQDRLKRSGSAQPKFEAVEKAQQEAVKSVIRNTAKQTSQLTGPISEEPGAAMRDATTATFSQGRSMYDALDGQLKGYSAPLNSASRVVQDAVTRARKLGVDVDASADSVLFDGKKITPKDNPGLWQKLHEQGVVDQEGNGTPLAAYKSVYSQLLKMQRAASDEAVRYNIGQEIKAMDGNMQSALKGTPIYENWKDADAVWAKAYALRDVADAVESSTKGTPAAQQAPGVEPVPTKLQGSALVDRLNTLAENGILRKAFTPEEAKNLRQSADILDRIQRTPTGKGFGESLNRSRGLAHAVGGAKGPLIGAGIGGAVGLLSGSPIIGAEAGAGLGFLVQAIGERSLVRIMTDTKGMQALDSYAKAKTLPARTLALRKLATLAKAAAVTGGKKYDVETGTNGASPNP